MHAAHVLCWIEWHLLLAIMTPQLIYFLSIQQHWRAKRDFDGRGWAKTISYFAIHTKCDSEPALMTTILNPRLLFHLFFSLIYIWFRFWLFTISTSTYSPAVFVTCLLLHLSLTSHYDSPSVSVPLRLSAAGVWQSHCRHTALVLF